MPYLKQLTYREFKNLMVDVKTIDTYIQENPILTNTAAFVENMYSLSMAEQAEIPLITIHNYEKYANAPANMDLVFVQLYAYYRELKTTPNKRLLLHPDEAFTSGAVYVVRGSDSPDPSGHLWSERYYTSARTNDKEGDIKDAIADIRFYYLFQAYRKYSIIATHVISMEYIFTSKYGVTYPRFPMIVSTPYIYRVDASRMITLCPEGLWHKECMMQTSRLVLSWYSRPRQVRETQTRRQRLLMLTERLRALRVQRARLLFEARQIKLECYHAKTVPYYQEDLDAALETSDTDTDLSEVSDLKQEEPRTFNALRNQAIRRLKHFKYHYRKEIKRRYGPHRSVKPQSAEERAAGSARLKMCDLYYNIGDQISPLGETKPLV